MIAAFAALGGLLVGSFLNVVACRLPRGESLVAPALALPRLRHAGPAVRQRAGALVARCCAGAAATAASRSPRATRSSRR